MRWRSLYRRDHEKECDYFLRFCLDLEYLFVEGEELMLFDTAIKRRCRGCSGRSRWTQYTCATKFDGLLYRNWGYFFSELGLTSELFLNNFNYYFSKKEQTIGLTFEKCCKFIVYVIDGKKSRQQQMEAFKALDQKGIGQITTSDLLSLL